MHDKSEERDKVVSLIRHNFLMHLESAKMFSYVDFWAVVFEY